jgi:hypothetical protein
LRSPVMVSDCGFLVENGFSWFEVGSGWGAPI